MNSLLLIITGIIAAIATFIVSIKYEQGAVRASAGLSLIVGLFFYMFPELLSNTLTKNIPLVFIGASFAGMVSSKILSSYTLVGISGGIFSLIYLNASTFFTGYGGNLGTVACISVLVSFGLNSLINKTKNRNNIHNR